MNVYTIIYTTNLGDDVESIPWQLSFTSLQAAKLHVIEEAAVCLMHVQSVVGIDVVPIASWDDAAEYSQFVQQYSGLYRDSWMIVRTELVDDSQVERTLDNSGLACYNESFRTQDGETNVTYSSHASNKS